MAYGLWRGGLEVLDILEVLEKTYYQNLLQFQNIMIPEEWLHRNLAVIQKVYSVNLP